MHTEIPTEEAIVKPDHRKGYHHDAIVLTMDALLADLHDRAFEAKLAAYPDGSYTIFFREWEADISPNDELWKKLAEIAETYTLEIVPKGAYCPVDHSPWTGCTNVFDRFRFKHVKITNRVDMAAAA